MKILKFGGQSLTPKGLSHVIPLITQHHKNGPIAIVVSAMGDATNQLETLLTLAKNQENYQQALAIFKRNHIVPHASISLFEEMALIKQALSAVRVLGDYSNVTRDLVLAQGEIIAVKTVTALLQKKGISAISVQAHHLLTTTEGNPTSLNETISQQKTTAFFNQLPDHCIPIITGFIAANSHGQITTLGRNGSNYTASAIAQYIGAQEVCSYTHVNGVFTANPLEVPEAKSIPQLSYQEAHELANFGADILHHKTIAPLAKAAIPLRILNTYNPAFTGTLVHHTTSNGVRSISVKNDVSLISIAGSGLHAQIGIDGRIFTTLEQEQVSVSVVSQGSSERGISFIVASNDAEKSVHKLRHVFNTEIHHGIIDTISANSQVGVITIVGQEITHFHRSLKSLSSNKIPVLLVNNTPNGQNISVVVAQEHIRKATNLIHAQIFGVAKRLNIAIFGIGNVGQQFMHQLANVRAQLLEKREIDIRVFAIANSKRIWFPRNPITTDWQQHFNEESIPSCGIDTLRTYSLNKHLENLVFIDNTASGEIAAKYPLLVREGYDLISSNKLANTGNLNAYHDLRKTLKANDKHYLYETNVGAGLPLIDTIKLLHDSGENITRIKGIFSGSLSFIFNQFSERKDSFSTIIQEAMDQGYTEPDPREDLSGTDVARKLLILARELDLDHELTDITVENLVPEKLQSLPLTEFLAELDTFDSKYHTIKHAQEKGHVLRYIGDLSGDLQQRKGTLKVTLASVPKNSTLGQVEGSDSIIEIFTDSYGVHPLVIQGAGAGSDVTARGVLGDLLRLSERK